MLKNFLVFIVILFSVLVSLPTKAVASDGIVELNNTNGSNARCFVMSTPVNRSTSYQLQIRCHNLIYPVEPQGMFYILWANSIGNDLKTIRVGDIEFGTGSFNVQNAFSGLFITKEKTQNPDQPSNETVMQGNIKPIPFLQTEPTPTITASPTIIPVTTTAQTTLTPEIVTPTAQPQNGGDFSVIMLIVIIMVVIFIAGIVFFVSKKIRNL